MNSESEQKLSLEQLKQRNTQEQPAPTPPPEVHPTREEWSELLAILSAQYRLSVLQHDLMEELLKKLRSAPTAAQAEEILRELRTLREAVQQAGKPKEKSFSMPRFPRLRLPHLSAPAIISLLLAAAVLLLLWWGLGTVWNSFSLLSL